MTYPVFPTPLTDQQMHEIGVPSKESSEWVEGDGDFYCTVNPLSVEMVCARTDSEHYLLPVFSSPATLVDSRRLFSYLMATYSEAYSTGYHDSIKNRG